MLSKDLLLFYYFSLFDLIVSYIFAQTIPNLLLDKHRITLSIDINAHII